MARTLGTTQNGKTRMSTANKRSLGNEIIQGLEELKAWRRGKFKLKTNTVEMPVVAAVSGSRKKRDLFAELAEGFDTLKAQREGKIMQRQHIAKRKPAPKVTAIELKRGSGNVFQDVGFPPAEAENLMLRAQLMSHVRDAARGASQREACKRFGITQPRLNDVLRGSIDKFSLDALVNMLAQAGMRVELRVKKAA